MRTRRKIRLPKDIIDVLRDLRDSYSEPRPIPQLVSAALRQTRVSTCQSARPTTRNDSEVIEVWLDEEFADLPHGEIVARVSMVVDGLNGKTYPDVINMNRTGMEL